jgi:hypothetical protein
LGFGLNGFDASASESGGADQPQILALVLALGEALCSGVNFVDCGAGASGEQVEVLLAKALEDLFESETAGSAKPKAKINATTSSSFQGSSPLVIVTRVGLASAAEAEHWRTSLEPPPRCFFGEDERALCLDERTIVEQILASKGRLGMTAGTSTIGRLAVPVEHYVLLESPERLLAWVLERGAEVDTAKTWLQEHLSGALEILGKLVNSGQIAGFGVSSEAFDLPAQDPLAIRLEDVLSWATARGARGGFKLVSWPLNWIELTGLIVPAGEDRPVLCAIIQREALGLIAHRPLNAMSRGQLVRLARPGLDQSQLALLGERERQAFKNWSNLVDDLERMAAEVISDHGLAGYDGAPLQQVVLATLAALPEVNVVVTSMRRPEYVADAREALGRPKPLAARALVETMHENLVFEGTAG